MKAIIIFLSMLAPLMGIGQGVFWESFIQPGRAGKALETPEHLWVPTTAGLLQIDKSDGEAAWHNKVTAGLVSNSIEAVARHPQSNSLYIGTYDLALMVRPQGSTDWEHLPFPDSLGTGGNGMAQTFCLAFSPDGLLWVGTSIGLLSYDGSSWQHWELASPFLGPVWDLAFSADGDLFIASHGVFRLSAGGILEMVSPGQAVDGHHLFSYGYSSLHRADDGLLWFFTDTGTLAAYDGEEWSNFAFLPELGFSGSPLSVTATGEGRFEVLAPGRYAYEWDGSTWEETGAFGALEHTLGRYLLQDGRTVDLTDTALKWDDGTARVVAAYPFNGTPFNFQYDHLGQLWGMDGLGVLRNMATGEEVAFGGQGALVPGFSSYAFDSNGGLWGTFGTKVYHQAEEGWEIYHEGNSPVPDAFGQRLFPGYAHGEMWMSVHGEGVFHFKQGIWSAVAPAVLPNFYLADLAAVPGGAWLAMVGAGESYLAFWDGNTLDFKETGEGGFPGQPIEKLAYEAETGRLWALGYQQLWYLEDGNWQAYELPFTAGEGAFFRGLILQGSRKILWSQNLVAVESDGEWNVFRPDNSPLDNGRITAVGADLEGGLWAIHGNRPLVDYANLGAVPAAAEETQMASSRLYVLSNPVRSSTVGLEVEGELSSRARVWLVNASGLSMPCRFEIEGEGSARLLLPALPNGWYTAIVADEGKRWAASFILAR